MNEPVVQFGFGTHDAFERTEALEVGTTHIGDEAEIGFGDLDEFFDIARVRSAHLDDRHIVRARYT